MKEIATKRIWILGVLFFMTSLFSHAQVPVLKIDLNFADRKEAEVNEPGYIPWPLGDGPGSITLEGVKFEFKNGSVVDSWYKVGVQVPYYARLAADGIKTDNVELHISGLSSGPHSLAAFHNTFDRPESNVFSPIDIFVNDVLIIDDLEPSTRILDNDSSATSYLEFEVDNNDTVIIRYQSDPKPNSTTDIIPICGLHLNKPDPQKMARFEYPEDRDEHVDIDNDTLVFYWKSPDNTISHNIYFGTNQSDVLSAGITSAQYTGNITDTFFVRTGFYSMDSCFWRVDPINSEGDTTKGDVWYFKKRIPAFPGAEGYGGYAIGGRGGKVVYVTNLNDDGPGSFRDAVENESGPRTILFAASGLITLDSRLVIRDDYITVAGQSAPGKGVCFRWAPIGVVGDNLIVQNLRMRLGIGVTYDGMGLTGAESSIIDHCSISWTIDEAFSSRGAKNITLQRTLISEALNAAGHDNYPPGSRHGYAASIGGYTGSFHHNLLAHCAGRNWSLAGGLDGDNYYTGLLDITNNIVYNWDGRTTDGGAHEVNFVNNYYKPGAACDNTVALTAQHEAVGLGTQRYYFNGNVMPGYFNETSQEDGRDIQGDVNYETFVDSPFFESLVTAQSAGDAFKVVLSDVGCTQPVFDDHDIRIINETLTGTYSIRGSVTYLPGLPDHEQDVGGWEEYPGFLRTANWDTDLDGLPNWWEKAHGLDTNSVAEDFSESNADDDRNGYTSLEEYLHWIARPHYFLNPDENIGIDLSSYTRGFTSDPEFAVSEIINGNATISANSSIVNFSPLSEGMAEFKFTVTDAEGSSMSQIIGLYIGEIAGDSTFSYSYYKDRSKTEIVYVGDKPESISHIKDGNKYFSVFPNPSNDLLNLSLESDINAGSEIYIVDLAGKIMLHESHYFTKGLNSVNIDISALRPGIYTLNIINNEFNKAVHFIKR